MHISSSSVMFSWHHSPFHFSCSLFNASFYLIQNILPIVFFVSFLLSRSINIFILIIWDVESFQLDNFSTAWTVIFFSPIMLPAEHFPDFIFIFNHFKASNPLFSHFSCAASHQQNSFLFWFCPSLCINNFLRKQNKNTSS